MFNQVVSSGAELFVVITVCIIAIVAGIMHVDIFKEVNKKSDKNGSSH